LTESKGEDYTACLDLQLSYLTRYSKLPLHRLLL
jgi:hypothetical protein